MVQPRGKKMKFPCIMNILKETNKIVEIEFMYNVRLVTSLCFMIWNDMIGNDMIGNDEINT